jgi:ribosomal protein L11 methyltransferase
LINPTCGTLAAGFFMNNYFQIVIPLQTEDQSEILVAILSESGYSGFEQGELLLHAFIPEDIFNDEELKTVLAPFSLHFTKEFVAKKNWNEEWERSFDPVNVEDFCVIRASFHAPVFSAKYEIIITPKMSFGTGHHATTFLMIKAMREINFANKSVLDFGTGTGLLSILAEKLGATEIVAIDIDDCSIENAKENIGLNMASKIQVEKNDRIPALTTDIILANINKHVILGHLPVMKQQLAPAGVLLLSGLLMEDVEEIREATQKHGFKEVRFFDKDDWICVHLENQL